jgi:flavin-dependent dehydrogenase
VVRGRLALVGDASGYLDAITGEGLALAFHQAFALVDALQRGHLATYARAHRRVVALPDLMTRLLLLVERHPWLRRRVIGALAADPALFSRLIAVHARQLAPNRSWLEALLRLGWRMLPP